MIINDDGIECKSKNIEGLFENINYKKKELINLCGYRQPAQRIPLCCPRMSIKAVA